MQALFAQNPFLTLKMIDSALANEHQLILRKKTVLASRGSEQAQYHCKGSKNDFPSVRGGSAHKTHFWPWRWEIQILQTDTSWFYAKNWLSTWGSEQAYDHCKGSEIGFYPEGRGGGLTHEKFKNIKGPCKPEEKLLHTLLIKDPALVFVFMA